MSWIGGRFGAWLGAWHGRLFGRGGVPGYTPIEIVANIDLLRVFIETQRIEFGASVLPTVASVDTRNASVGLWVYNPPRIVTSTTPPAVSVEVRPIKSEVGTTFAQKTAVSRPAEVVVEV